MPYRIVDLSKPNNQKHVVAAGKVLAEVMRGPPYHEGNWLTDTVGTQIVRQTMLKTHGTAYAFVKNGVVVGVAGAYSLKDFTKSQDWQNLHPDHRKLFQNPAGNYYLDFVAVLPEHRGEGIAHSLAQRRESYARKEGFTHASFRTITPERIALAISMGYDEIFRHEASGRTADSKVTKRRYFQKKL